MIKAGIVGGVFGLVLLALAVDVTGGGHGVYFPLGVAAAPLSLLGILPAVLGVVPVWVTLGAWSAGTQTARQRLWIALMLQLVAAVVAVSVGPFADLGYLNGPRQVLMPRAVLIVVLFAAAHLVLWVRVRSRRT